MDNNPIPGRTKRMMPNTRESAPATINAHSRERYSRKATAVMISMMPVVHFRGASSSRRSSALHRQEAEKGQLSVLTSDARRRSASVLGHARPHSFDTGAGQ